VKIHFGIGLGSSVGLLAGSDAQAFMDLVKMADGYGAAAIGTYDSAFLGGDSGGWDFGGGDWGGGGDFGGDF
jgi:hypothetical protein